MAQTQNTPQAEHSKKDRIIQELISWGKSLLFAVVLMLVLTNFVFQVVYVDGSSMAETLHSGDRMFVTKYEYLLGDPARYDVVVCRYPDRGNTNFVKRVVAVPGDTVAMYGGVLYVNGEAIEEEYIDYPARQDMAETIVEEDHYFVMGDNRASSNDSRNPRVGQLTRDQIHGKVRAVIWPLPDFRVIH